MTDLESMAARVDRLERQLRATRAISACAVTLAVALGAVGACTHHAPARTAPPNKIELRDPAGLSTVTIDGTGISVKNKTSTTWIGSDAVATHDGSYWATLSAGSLKLTGADGGTTLERNALSMEHGKHSITAKVDTDKASLVLSSDNLHRAVEMTAGMYYATVSTLFLPDDLGPPFSGQLGADKDGGQLTVADGNVERSFKLDRSASRAGRR